MRQERLVHAAERWTGLSDFGSSDYLEPLALLVHGYDSEARPTRLGAVGAWVYLHRMLCNRLQLTERLRRTPAIAEEVIRSPIFILGLPRTGSTLLHEVMDLHPTLRAPTFWETSFLPAKGPSDRLRRIAARLQVTAAERLAPGFRSVHRLGAERPHECVTIQAGSLRSMQFHVAHRLPSYNAWLRDCDWLPAYRFHKRYLQWLQHGESPRRWVLKAPGHMLGLDALTQVYPDALFVQLHRDPCQVMPSMASLTLHLRRPFSRRVDLEEIGRDVTEQWLAGITKTLEARRRDEELDARFLDVHYRELVRSPAETLRRIDRFCGLGFDEPACDIVGPYLDSHPKGRHGRHSYTLEQFGLDAERLTEQFADYNRTYGLSGREPLIRAM
jgi:hypothetical protein